MIFTGSFLPFAITSSNLSPLGISGSWIPLQRSISVIWIAWWVAQYVMLWLPYCRLQNIVSFLRCLHYRLLPDRHVTQFQPVLGRSAFDRTSLWWFEWSFPRLPGPGTLSGLAIWSSRSNDKAIGWKAGRTQSFAGDTGYPDSLKLYPFQSRSYCKYLQVPEPDQRTCTINLT